MTDIQLLISESTLKKRTIISDNVESKYIAPTIVKAQEIGLQPLIGTNLYDKLCSLASDSSIEQPSNLWYKRLLDDYITPYLCYRVMADIQIPLFAKNRNAGITQSQDQQTTQLSLQDVEYIRKQHEYDADFCAKRMTDWLQANNIHFPEWRTKRDNADMQSNPEAFNTHIVL